MTPRLPTATPFSCLVTVESRKLTDTRGARWLLAVIALLSALGTLLPVLRPRMAQSMATYLDLAAIGPLLLGPVVVVLLVTAEWSQRTAVATFLQEPRRGRVLAAKAVLALAVGVVTAAAVLALAWLGLAVSAALGRDVDPWPAAGPVVGLVLSMCLSLLASVALAALVQNTSAAVAAVYVLPLLVAVLVPWLGPVGPYVDLATASEQVARTQWAGHAGTLLAAHALWLGVPAAAGAHRWGRRDVA